MRRPHLLPLTVRQAAYLACVLIAATLAASCAQVPLSSLIGLRKLDMETTDPARLRVAVRHPDWIRVPPGAAVMEVEQRDKRSGERVLGATIAFAPSGAGEDLATLAQERRSGSRLVVFRVAPEDAARLREVQKRIREQSPEQRSRLEGSLSVRVSGCRVGEMPEGPVPVSTYLAASEFDGFLPLVRDFDLREAMLATGAPRHDPIGACPPDTAGFSG